MLGQQPTSSFPVQHFQHGFQLVFLIPLVSYLSLLGISLFSVLLAMYGKTGKPFRSSGFNQIHLQTCSLDREYPLRLMTLHYPMSSG